MRKYGDYSDLNEVTASQIKEIINEIETCVEDMLGRCLWRG